MKNFFDGEFFCFWLTIIKSQFKLTELEFYYIGSVLNN